MKPRVTVALPVHNAAGTLPETVASVRAQSFERWELVIACNGCTDGSVEIAQGAAGADPRIRVEVMPHPDLVGACNLILEGATASLMARIDADDLMPRGRLAAQVAAMDAHPEWAACTGHVVHAGGPGGMARHVDWLNGLLTSSDMRVQRFVDSPVANPSATMRVGAMRQLGGYRRGAFAEDYDFWLRLLEAGATIGRVEAPALVWRDLPTRLTRTDSRYAVDAMRDLKHRFLMSGPLAHGERSCVIWGSGPYGKRHARGLRSLGAHVEAFVDIDPRKIGGMAAGGVPVMSPEQLGPPSAKLVLIAVASRGARKEVMSRLAAAGFVPELDYLPVQ